MNRILPIVLLLVLAGCANEPPNPAIFLSKNIEEWRRHFEVYNQEGSWSVQDSVLLFSNPYEVGMLTLSVANLPDNETDEGNLYASVDINGDYDAQMEGDFYGFMLGDGERSIRFGVSGSGQLQAFDENMTPLAFNIGENKCLRKAGIVGISFCLYKNTKGWLIEYFIHDCGHEMYSRVGRISATVFSVAGPSEIGLVARNTAGSSTVWFKNLRIARNWVPFD